jgi:hypothetical protein
MKHKRLWFSGIFAALLVAVTVAGLEFLSSFVVPPWPSRELRPIEVSNASVASTLTGTQPVPTYNSWGMRDREHPLEKPRAPSAPSWSATVSSKAPSSKNRSAPSSRRCGDRKATAIGR